MQVIEKYYNGLKIEQGRATIIPGVLLIGEIYKSDMECFSDINNMF